MAPKIILGNRARAVRRAFIWELPEIVELLRLEVLAAAPFVRTGPANGHMKPSLLTGLWSLAIVTIVGLRLRQGGL